MHVKDKPCNSPEGLELETPTQVFSSEYFKSFTNDFFYRTPAVAAFEFYVLVSETIFKKES